jgi:hypothetical protein
MTGRKDGHFMEDFGGNVSSKFSYFRHSVNARNDDKIQEFSRLLDRKSKEAYFYFFTLLELCSSESREGQIEFKIHNNTLRSLWETNTKGVQVVCELLASSALVVCETCETYVVFHIPKLPIYLGSYETKKEKKIKEKKENIYKSENQNFEQVQKIDFASVKKSKVSPDSLVQKWNDEVSGNGKLSVCYGLSGQDNAEFIKTVSFKQFNDPAIWAEAFKKVSNSDFLNGGKGTFTATLNWLVKHENILKVLNGQYSGGAESFDDYISKIKLEA